jgi:stearoyl-CoA 9-desaturase NADPH oxidoreductase
MFTQTIGPDLNPSLAPARSSLWRRLARSAWLRPLNDLGAVDDVLRGLNAMWSLREIRARVVSISAETADTTSIVLRPNARWPGHKAGQHVVVQVEIDGVRHHRSFSLSSAPRADGTLRITAKRHSQSRVARWIHEELRVGEVLTISAPAGEFVLPATTPQRLLLISAGSGITPAMAVLQELKRRDDKADVVFVHTCRTPDDRIFARELELIASDWPGLRIELHHSAEAGRLDIARLQALVPDFAGRTSYFCGPPALGDAVRTLYRQHHAEAQLRSEDYGGRIAARRVDALAPAHVTCARSKQAFTASGAQPLLIEAEAAGLKPRFGCRIGICRTCQCRKRSGSVENLRTGEISAEPDQLIQLCISAARSDLELDL